MAADPLAYVDRDRTARGLITTHMRALVDTLLQDEEVLDAALAAAAQTVEHCEISRYGTLIAWARELGRADCAPSWKTR